MLNYHVLDVFTQQPFTGNPLAVVLGADALTSTQMQTITREFNLSETIFVQTPKDPAHSAKVRIFCPACELPFAGHPTIGCAILLAELAHDGDFECEITLEEAAGLVPVKVIRHGADITAEFVAPVLPEPVADTLPTPDDAARALGLGPRDIGFDHHKPMHWQGGPDFLFIPLATREALRKARPAASWSTMTAKAKTQSVYLYTPLADGYAARMFAPGHGTPEDPATGSASAILAAQLLAAGALPEGNSEITLTQGAEMSRPSRITLKASVQNGALANIRVAGAAVRVFAGQIGALPL